MNGLNKLLFKNFFLFVLLVSLVSEPIFTSSGILIVNASSVTSDTSNSSNATSQANATINDSNEAATQTSIDTTETSDSSTDSNNPSSTSITNEENTDNTSVTTSAEDKTVDSTADSTDTVNTANTDSTSDTDSTSTNTISGTDSTDTTLSTDSTSNDTTTNGTTTSTDNSKDTTVNTNELEISKEIFPDELFRTYILKHFDMDKNEKLSNTEILQVESIDVSNMGIEDLSGIEYFTNINYLYCNGNNLKTLNLSTLANMTVLNCSYNHLSSLDLSKCTSLVSIECENNSFAIPLDDNNSFDLANEKDMNIENVSNWSSNVTTNDTILTLSDTTTKLITYDYLVNAPLITNTYIHFSFVITSDNLKDVEITETTFADNSFREYIETNFDKDKNSILSNEELNEVTYMYAPSKQITELTGIEKFPNLVFLNFDDNAITSTDLKALTSLSGVYFNNNKLNQIILGESVNLKELYLSNNELTTLDTSLLHSLTKLYCDGNLLTSLDTSCLTNLTELNCSKNKLYCLDLGSCIALQLFECNDNLSDVTIDSNHIIDLTTLPLLDLTKVTSWSIGSLNEDNKLLLDNYTDGMSIQYTYIINSPINAAPEITFTLLPKLADIAPSLTGIVPPQTETAPPQAETALPQTETTPPQTETALPQTEVTQPQTDIAPQTSSVPSVSTPAIANYTVSFNTDGGNTIDSQTVASGNKATEPTNPTKSGYLFDGWYIGDSKYDFNTAISNDTTITSHWNIVSPPKPTIKKLKNSKKSQMKITLKSSKNIDGYEISYSTNKTARKNAIIVETSKTSYTVKNLVKGKTYYVRVRTFSLDSTGEKIYSKYSKIKKLAIAKGLNEVKATSTSATIKSCKITSGSNVSVAVKTKDIIKSKDNYYYLFQLPSYKKSISKRLTPLAQAQKATSLTFETPLNLNTQDSLLYSKFVVAIKVKSGYKIISSAKYITNPQDIATYTYSFPQASSKKGLQINASMINDVKDLGVKNSAFNIPLDMIIAAPGENNYHSGIDYEYNGETYWFRKGMISAYDSLFRKLERQDIVVTAIVLLGWRDDLTYLISPSAREEGHNYYNFNTSNSKARKQLEATFSFLAERYASGDGNGKVVNWIIGNEINSFDAWNYAGTRSLSKHTQLYADSYRLAYTAITSVYRNARLYVSLDQCWNISNSTTFAAKEFLDKFASIIKESGNIKWNIAYHAYPSPLTNPRFWKNTNGLSQNNANSPVISIYNIKVLTDFVKKHYGKGTRIILSEQGFTSAQPYGEKVQAAAMAYAYYLSEFNPMIDAFILSRHVDNVAETSTGLNLGLWSNVPGEVEEAYQKKYAWNVYKYMDTPNSTQATKFALKIIGTSSWKKIIPKYKAKKFNSMPSAN